MAAWLNTCTYTQLIYTDVLERTVCQSLLVSDLYREQNATPSHMVGGLLSSAYAVSSLHSVAVVGSALEHISSAVLTMSVSASPPAVTRYVADVKTAGE